MSYTATYSPEDNKLRLYTSQRLDAATYSKAKALGFKWAPKQDLFVAPMWTPEREDFLIELAGEIEDEDSTLVERAEARADRFEGYKGSRAREAASAQRAVHAIADHIPFGQPILVGHHSERRARKDVERIRSGMARAVKAWKTADYWRDRAAGAIASAKYKELPAVRARRIKTLEAEQRKVRRNLDNSNARLLLWRKVDDPKSLTRRGEEVTFAERVRHLLNGNGNWQLWSDLEAGRITAEEARDRAIASSEAYLPIGQRWFDHYENRLTYERAMLAESGGYQPPPKRPSKATLPILNYGGTVSYRNPYNGDLITGEPVGLSKAQWAAIGADYKGTRISACGTHRLRTTMMAPGYKHSLVPIYLTDSKQHPRPTVEDHGDEDTREACIVSRAAEVAD